MTFYQFTTVLESRIRNAQRRQWCGSLSVIDNDMSILPVHYQAISAMQFCKICTVWLWSRELLGKFQRQLLHRTTETPSSRTSHWHICSAQKKKSPLKLLQFDKKNSQFNYKTELNKWLYRNKKSTTFHYRDSSFPGEQYRGSLVSFANKW